MNEHVEVPINEVVFLKFVGLVFDTGFIPEDELEDDLWTFPDEID